MGTPEQGVRRVVSFPTCCNTCRVRSAVWHLLGAIVLALCAPLVMTPGVKASANPAECRTTTSADTSGVHARICLQVIRIKHLPLRQLEAVLRRQSALLGEHHPTHAAVVISTRRAATTLTGSIENEDTPIYFVQAEGHFICDTCSGFGGAKLPTGRYLTLGLGLDHLEILAFGIADQHVNLRVLGPIHRLRSR
jgi:hypothetical protein